MTDLNELLSQAAQAIQGAQAETQAETQAADVPTSASEEVATASQYTVQYGDTLASIAAACGVSEAHVMELNGLVNDNLIVGSTLALA